LYIFPTVKNEQNQGRHRGKKAKKAAEYENCLNIQRGKTSLAIAINCKNAIAAWSLFPYSVVSFTAYLAFALWWECYKKALQHR
jgi:hypothetical protein